MPENLFQSEAESAKPLIRKELFCSRANTTHFHKKGFSLNFALKVRVINGYTQYTLKGRAERLLIGCRFRGSLCSPLTILQRIKSSTCMLSVVFSLTNQRFFCPAHTEMDQIYT